MGIDIKYYCKMRNIQRLSMMFTHRPYNLLEHQYLTTVLFRHFASLEDVPYDMNVLDLVMNHDCVESETSDLPWDIKNFSEETKKCWNIIEKEVCKKHFQLNRYSDENLKSGMTKLQHDLFKAVDTLDLMIFVSEEINLGNNTVAIRNVLHNCYEILNKIESQFPHVNEFIKLNCKV